MGSCVDAGGVDSPHTGFIRSVHSLFRHASARNIYSTFCQRSRKAAGLPMIIIPNLIIRRPDRWLARLHERFDSRGGRVAPNEVRGAYTGTVRQRGVETTNSGNLCLRLVSIRRTASPHRRIETNGVLL
jgi:hypothetical protein